MDRDGSALPDAACEQGLIAFDDHLRLLLSTRIRNFLPDGALKQEFEAHEEQALQFPEDGVSGATSQAVLNHQESVAASKHALRSASVLEMA